MYHLLLKICLLILLVYVHIYLLLPWLQIHVQSPWLQIYVQSPWLQIYVQSPWLLGIVTERSNDTVTRAKMNILNESEQITFTMNEYSNILSVFSIKLLT